MDIIDIKVIVQDFASGKLAQIRRELDKLGRSQTTLGQTARALDAELGRVQSRVGTSSPWERQVHDLERMRDQVRSLQQDLKNLMQGQGQLQIPRALAASPLQSAFEGLDLGDPNRGVPIRNARGQILGNTQQMLQPTQRLIEEAHRMNEEFDLMRQNQLSLFHDIPAAVQPGERAVRDFSTEWKALEKVMNDAGRQVESTRQALAGIDRTIRLTGESPALTKMRDQLVADHAAAESLFNSLDKIRSTSAGGGVDDLSRAVRDAAGSFPQLREELDKLDRSQKAFAISTARADREQELQAQQTQNLGGFLSRLKYDEATTRLNTYRNALTKAREELDKLHQTFGTSAEIKEAEGFGRLAREVGNAENEVKKLEKATQGAETALLKIGRSVPRGAFGGLRRDIRGADGDISAFLRSSRRLGTDVEGDVKQLEGSFGLLASGANSLRQRLDDLSRVDEALALGILRMSSFFLALSSLLPVIASLFGVVLAGAVALTGGAVALAGALSTLVGVLAVLPAGLAGVAGALGAALAVFGPGVNLIVQRVKELDAIQKRQRTSSAANRQSARDATAEQNLQLTRIHNAEQVADIDREIFRARRDNAQREQDDERTLHRIKMDNRRHEAALEASLAATRSALAQEQTKLEQALSAAQAQEAAARARGANDVVVAALHEQTQIAQRNLELLPTTPLAQQARQQAAQVQQQRITDRRQEADAQRQLQRDRVHDAEQLADLERRRSRLIRDNAAQEAQALRQTRTAAIAAGETQAQALQGLNPVEKRIVLGIQSIRKEWDKLTLATRLRGERLAERALGFIQQNMPAIAKVVDGFAGDMVKMGGRLFNIIREPKNLRAINQLFKTGRILMNDFGGAALKLIGPLAQLGAAAAPLAEHLGKAVQDLASGAGKQLTKNLQPTSGVGEGVGRGPGARIIEPDRASNVQKFLGDTREVVDLLGSALGNLGVAFKNILKIAEPFGEILLQDFDTWTKHVREWTESREGKKALTDFFSDAVPAAEHLIRTVARLVEALFKVGRALIRPGSGGGSASSLDDLLNAIEGGLPGLQSGLIRMTTHTLPQVIKFFKEFFNLIDSITKPGGPLPLIITLINTAIGLFNKLGPLRAPLATFILSIFATKPILTFLGLLRSIGGTARGAVTAIKVLSTGARTGQFRAALEAVFPKATAAARTFRRMLALVALEAKGMGSALRKALSGLGGDTGSFNPGAIADAFKRAKVRALEQLALLRAGVVLRFRQIAAAIRESTIVANLSAMFSTLGELFVAFRATMIGAFLTNPVTIAILAIIAVVLILNAKFHFLMPVIRAVGEAFKVAGTAIVHGFTAAIHGIRDAVEAIIGFLKRNWKTIAEVMIALFVPGGLIIVAFMRWRRQIVAGFEFLVGKLEAVGRAIAHAFVRGFSLIGSFFASIGSWLNQHIVQPILHFFGISSPSSLFYSIGLDVVHGFVNAFKLLPGLVLDIIKKLPGLVSDVAKGLPKLVVKELEKIPVIGKIVSKVGDVIGGAKSLVHKGWKWLTGATGGVVPGTPPPHAGVDNIPAMVRSGEWIINDRQKAILSGLTGLTPERIQAALFTTRGRAGLSFAGGGVVPQLAPIVAGGGGTTVHAPISIQTTSPTVDVEYVARALKGRMGSR